MGKYFNTTTSVRNGHYVYLIHTGSQGYFFEKKYPQAQGIFIFDNAPSHMKKPEDALNVERMNVRDGGKQPFMCDTVWDRETQQMTTTEGFQKGMKTVLEERGVDAHGMNAAKMRERLHQFQASYDRSKINCIIKLLN